MAKLLTETVANWGRRLMDGAADEGRGEGGRRGEGGSGRGREGPGWFANPWSLACVREGCRDVAELADG